MSEITSSAKLAYLLSTCHDFADKFFIRVIKKHESNYVACAKYYYSFWVVLKAPQDSSPFSLNRVFDMFFNTTNSNMIQVLEHMNEIQPITIEQKNEIQSNFSKLTNHEGNCSITPINLILMYAANANNKNKYKYLFIPTILDYGVDVGLVHQCCILIDLQNGIILFFDPYASYSKYNHDYSYPIKQYFELFTSILPPQFKDDQGNIKYYTYHEYFNLSNGIQNIILQKNNSKGVEFNIKFNKLIDDIRSAKFKTPGIQLDEKILNNIKSDTNPVNKTDETVRIMNTLEVIENYHSDNDHIMDDDRINFNKIWEGFIELYHFYNSKTCVSITLVEIDFIFNNADLSKNDLEKKIKELYNIFETSDIPNTILMKKISDLVDNVFDDAIKVKEQINSTNNTQDICNMLG